MDQALLKAIRELVDELNLASASGLLTHRALILTLRVQQHLRRAG